MSLKIDSKLNTRFPDLTALTLQIKDVKIQKRDAELEKFKLEIVKQVRREYDLDAVKDQPIFRSYRSFFWKNVEPLF